MASIFLAIDGVEGESTDDRHPGEIELEHWSFGIANSGTTHLGGGGAGAGKAVFTDLSVHKRVDTATPVLLQAAANGKRLHSATLSARTAGATPFDYLTMVLSDVMVAACSVDGEGDDPPHEHVVLSFAKVQVSYTKQAADGSAGTTTTFGWDVARNDPV